MKKIKYYSSLVIILVAWILISEIYVLHMENFQSEFPYMTFYRPYKVSQEVMIEEISKSATANSLKLFVVEHKINSLSSKEINIYSTTDVSKDLNKKSYVSVGSYNSIFLGKVKVSYRHLSEIANIDDFSYYYYIGEKENAIELKKELVDKYGGKFPKEGYMTQNYRQNVVVVWGLAFSFLLLLSAYQILLEKKMLAVRILMGESLGIIILKKVSLDILIWSSEIFITQVLIGTYGNTFAGYQISYMLFLVFLLISCLLYIPLFKMDVQKSIKNVAGKGVLIFSYAYKIVIIAIFVILTVGCMKLIFSGIDYYKQKEFFWLHKDYVYSKIELEDSEETNRVRFEFYHRCLAEEKVITLNQIESYSDSDIYICR